MHRQQRRLGGPQLVVQVDADADAGAPFEAAAQRRQFLYQALVYRVRAPPLYEREQRLHALRLEVGQRGSIGQPLQAGDVGLQLAEPPHRLLQRRALLLARGAEIGQLAQHRAYLPQHRAQLIRCQQVGQDALPVADRIDVLTQLVQELFRQSEALAHRRDPDVFGCLAAEPRAAAVVRRVGIAQAYGRRESIIHRPRC